MLGAEARSSPFVSRLAVDLAAAMKEQRAHAVRGLTTEEIQAGWMGERRTVAEGAVLGRPVAAPAAPRRARGRSGRAALSGGVEVPRFGRTGMLEGRTGAPPPPGWSPPEYLYQGWRNQPEVPAFCGCYGPSAFDTSCLCGAESVTCESRGGYCHCTGTCKQGVISEYDGKQELCVDPPAGPAVFEVLMMPCSTARAPEETSDRTVVGFLVVTPQALAVSWDRTPAAGCVRNNHDFLTVFAYDCDSRQYSVVPPNSSNCDRYVFTQRDWDYVAVGGRWYKMAGDEELILEHGRPTCTIESDSTAQGPMCVDTGIDVPAMPC